MTLRALPAWRRYEHTIMKLLQARFNSTHLHLVSSWNWYVLLALCPYCWKHILYRHPDLSRKRHQERAPRETLARPQWCRTPCIQIPLIQIPIDTILLGGNRSTWASAMRIHGLTCKLMLRSTKEAAPFSPVIFWGNSCYATGVWPFGASSATLNNPCPFWAQWNRSNHRSCPY